VTVANVPEHFDLIKVYRRTKGFDDRQLVKTLAGGNIFEDKNLIHGETYAYELEVYSNGAKVNLSSGWPIKGLSGCTAILTYFNPGPEDGRVNFDIVNTSIINGENYATHKLTIQQSISETPSAQYLREIAESTQSSLYAEELQGNKDETSLFTRYSISRTNTRTGKRETVNADAQADTEYTFSIAGAFARDEYEYDVEALIENLAAMSYLTVTTKVDVNSGKEYKFRYKKWLGKQTQDTLSLPSEKAIFNNSLYESIQNSRSGRIKKVLFSPASSQATITNISAQTDLANKCNWVEWSFSANTSDIDHFLILGRYNGVTAPIGAALPNDLKDGKYLYKDARLYGMFGTVDYSIIPVRRGFNYGNSSLAASINLYSNIPKKAIAE
jgi:hypothetical protein